MNELNINIDEMLEQVAVAMAEGDNDVAKQMLPKILASGDETQQLMAESYQMQLDMLLLAEGESEDINTVSDDAWSETFSEDDGLFVQDSLPEFINSNSIDPDFSTSQTELPIEKKSDNEDIIDNDILGNSNSSSISEAVTLQEVEHTETTCAKEEKTEDSIQANINQWETTEENKVEQTSISQLPPLIFKTTNNSREQIKQQLKKPAEHIESDQTAIEETVNIPTADTVINKNFQDAGHISLTNLKSEQNDSETSIALEQVAMLVDEGEYETANMLLQTIIGEQPENTEHINNYDVLNSTDIHPEETNTEPQVTKRDIASSAVEPIVIAEKEEDQKHSSVIVQHQTDGANVVEEQSDLESVPTEAEISPKKDSKQFVDHSVVLTIPDNEQISDLLSPSQALRSFSAESLESSYTEGEKAQATISQKQGFFIGEVGLMIDFADGSELTEIPQYFRVPNSPAWLMGLTNLHGIVIPIFNLQKYLNLEMPTDNRQMLLVLQHNEKAIGIIINGLPHRLSYTQSQQMEINTAPRSLSKHINGAYLINERLWFELDNISLCEKLEEAMEVG